VDDISFGENRAECHPERHEKECGWRGPTGARERFCGPDVILTQAVKGAREGARVKIMSGVPAKRGSGEQVGTRPPHSIELGEVFNNPKSHPVR